jgi:hypothetical protein
MKIPILIFLSIQLFLQSNNGYSQTKTYRLIKKTNSIPGDIDTKEIKRLDEPLKALAAFYSAMGGTMCNGDSCELTTELGLGRQGSEQHQSLIRKYFPNDKAAKAVLAQDCYLRPSGASSFSDYEYLTISLSGDTARVSYTLAYYDRGESSFTKSTDIYLYKNKVFKTIRRKLWTSADK